ncbi:MAG: hypothetical protein E6Q94_02150 [Burkholderiaceae bacterium]|jgi:hypothetical protein|nr:MAG: hypothetical protein E6Q94_02150 [Burkholderiaceae bacterium]
MWLMTPIGFFSIVQKPDDRIRNTLTIRARVKSDLEALRQGYLPDMGEILAHQGTDYRYRAVASKTSVASALSQLIADLDYDNFKDEVQHVQGDERARTYGEVWCALYRLQD